MSTFLVPVQYSSLWVCEAGISQEFLCMAIYPVDHIHDMSVRTPALAMPHCGMPVPLQRGRHSLIGEHLRALIFQMERDGVGKGQGHSIDQEGFHHQVSLMFKYGHHCGHDQSDPESAHHDPEICMVHRDVCDRIECVHVSCCVLF